MTAQPPIEFRPLRADESLEVSKWPPYSGRFSALDYVLRADGWLDTFPESTSNRRFAIVVEAVLVGFTMLVDIDGKHAEFYIAIHPEHTGKGIGREATACTLQIGFLSLGLVRIFLRVRISNVYGIRMYNTAGFRVCGVELDVLNNEPVKLQRMILTYSDFMTSRCSDASHIATSDVLLGAESISISKYGEWDPQEYLDEYYRLIMPDELITMQFLVESLREVRQVDRALDFGCGPTVHHSFPLVKVAGEIHLAEYIATNREHVEQWLQKRAEAFDWEHLVKLTLELEGVAQPGAEIIQEREQQLRERVTQVIPGDAFDAEPLGADRNYDLVTSHYCAEACTSDKRLWRLCMRNIMD